MPRMSAMRSILIGGMSFLVFAWAANAQTKSVDVPAQDLKTALGLYIRQSGVQILYNADELEGLRSHALRGAYEPVQALDLLLQGTGAIATRAEPGVFAIVKRPSRRDAIALPAEVPELGVEAITVTGTSIRGVAPVGVNMITLDRATIDASGAQTIQQMLSNVPAITGFGNGGFQFRAGGFGNTGEYLPTIHALGASSSQSTLVLIDGHPLVPSGHNGYTDPSILPTMAIQRIDVLPDGDSAIYGSSAVSGVINFVTRKNYEGFQTSLQYGQADRFNSFSASQMFGHWWAGGSILAVFEYKSNSTLLARDRSFSADQDLRRLGGSNFRNYNCSPATISASGSGTAGIFTYPYTDAAITTAGNTQGGICDYSGTQGIIPSATTHSAFLSIGQSLGERFTVDLSLGYHSRVNNDLAPQVTISALAFGPTGGSDALGAGSRNPFYVGNAITGTADEFVRYDFTDLIGPSSSKTGVRAIFANLAVNGNLGGGWAVEVNAVAGENNAFIVNSNILCQACALLALNGTTNTMGTAVNAIADPFGSGTVTSVTRKLNTENALDVWNSPATNRTSAQVLGELQGDATRAAYASNLNELRVKFDGAVTSLPAGDIKAAFGGEYSQYHNITRATANNNSGPTSSSSRLTYAPLGRTAYAAFVELFVPVISAGMQIPFMKKLDFQIAARYDEYSDFGAAPHPKVGFTWEATDGLAIRGSYGTSFTAPNLDGMSTTAFTTVGANATAFTVPANHPNYPGSFCAAITGPCNVSSAMQGIVTNSGNPDLKAMTGSSYSLGTDVDAGAFIGVLRGLEADVTYWQAKFLGGVTRPTLPNVLTVQGLQNLLLLAPPGGWTPASPEVQTALAGMPITSPLPAQIYYIYQGKRVNGLNVQASGIDFNAQYAFGSGPWGDLSLGVGGSEKLRYDIKGGPKNSSSPYVSFLNGHQDTSVLKAIQFAGRMSVNWRADGFDANFYWNFTNPYWFQSTNPPFNTLGLAPATGAVGSYQKIAANSTFDVNVAYFLPAGWFDGWSKAMQITLSVLNIADSAPPFYNLGSQGFNTTFTGYDIFNGNPVGRQVRIGLSKKW